MHCVSQRVTVLPVKAIGVEPVDYNAPDLAVRIRALAPRGVCAAFDHLGLDSARVSFSLLARGGSLIAYGNAAILNGSESMVGVFIVFRFNDQRNDLGAINAIGREYALIPDSPEKEAHLLTLLEAFHSYMRK